MFRRKSNSRFSSYRIRGLLIVGVGIIIWYTFSLPRTLFKVPYSTVLEDQQDQLLGARIAADGQWRFPELDSVPEKFAQAIIEFEDHRFYRHPGVDPVSIGRALVQNLRNREIVSGASTLTMQVIRMSRGNRPRNLWQKLVETVLATRLELRDSKSEILALYASHAPFGGNVVGLEAASWRYFGKNPELLSWAETCMLAVLPNNPAMIHPGRNRQQLLAKRNRLLDRLREEGVIDEWTSELAQQEPLPLAPLPLPRVAPHLLERARLSAPAGHSRHKISLDYHLQQQVNSIAERHLEELQNNGIHNLAILVAEVSSGAVKAYMGNVLSTGDENDAQVDLITAPRSTGSILKPFLYAEAQQAGVITPQTLLPDVPTTIGTYQPENFYDQYDGAVTAERSLVRSLNVPMVLLLRQYGLEKFHFQLQKWGLTTINRSPDHYGLTLILGGGEATLWDLTGAYANMGRVLNHFQPQDGGYRASDWRPLHYLLPAPTYVDRLQPHPPVISAGACWLTFQAMEKVERPNTLGEWEYFQSNQPIAWKTGTSFGYRDAWAVGITPRYVVGVWVGNADGEGRPGLVGVRAAAPVLFDVFDQLDGGGNFSPPLDEMERIPICKTSGLRPTSYCPQDTLWLLKSHRETRPCPYHQLVHLDRTQSFRVFQNCYPQEAIQPQPWFVLPPAQEAFYRTKSPSYQPLPPVHPNCRDLEGNSPIQLIYPRAGSAIFLPRDLDGNQNPVIFEAAYRYDQGTLHWHVDEQYIGSTQEFHKLELTPTPGDHRLILVDDQGNRLESTFSILSSSQ
jgi:penicillin-binding protein 1C